MRVCVNSKCTGDAQPEETPDFIDTIDTQDFDFNEETKEDACLSTQEPWNYDWQLVGYNDAIPDGYEGVTPARMRADEQLKIEVGYGMGTWAIIALGCGGKFDGPGYGMNISDSHGPECCA